MLVLAVYQLCLIAVGYGKVRLPFLAGRAASTAHRAAGDAIVTLVVLVAAACAVLYGFEGDYLLHGVAGAALVAVFAVKVVTVRSGGRLPLPVLGSGIFALIVLTWTTAAPDHL